ncbi:MAG: DUF4258 domain-containing protein [Spirochaetales bacterium]|nr:DUF4258 domain-containing protein [Spirochaetales bacterium]
MSKITDLITGHLTEYDLEYRIHATRRMFQRNIHEDDIELILKTGNIIEKYDSDFPLPSVLLNGKTSSNRPIHLVVGINTAENKLIIITAYEPDRIMWVDNYSRRIK